MEFLGREVELKQIIDSFDSEYFEGSIVYGRRRVGKSELLKQALKSFKGKVIYYQASLDSVTSNAISLSSIIKDSFPSMLIGESISFEEELDFLFKIGEKENLLLIIDEYPYMRDGKKTDSILQRLIDKYKHTSRLKLILCGSLVEVMKEMLLEDAPLFGRMKNKLEIKPFSYLDAAKFFPSSSNVDKFRYYATFGGIPYYLSLIDKRKSYEDNVKELLIKENSILEIEILTSLQKEINKIDKGLTILSSIANGSTSYREIKSNYAQRVGDENFDYINNLLIKGGFISKLSPIDGKEDKKKTYYAIEDNLLYFYYCLVFPKIAYRPLMDIDVFYTHFIKKRLEEYFLPLLFEKVSKEFLILNNRKKKLDSEDIFYEVGKYFYNSKKEATQIEVDIVTLDSFGYTFFECKYTKDKIGNPIINELLAKANNSKIKPYRLGFFSRNGFLDNIDKKNYLFYTLDDLYKVE